jgi:hypothetical protein
LSDWIRCGSCSLNHQARPDGLCPRCRRPTVSQPGPLPAGREGPLPSRTTDTQPASPPAPSAVAAGPSGAEEEAGHPEALATFPARRPHNWKEDVAYDLHVGRDRLVAVKTGGQFAAEGSGVAAGVAGGLIGALLLQLVRRRVGAKRSERREAAVATPFGELHRLDKANFDLPFSEIGAARLRRIAFTLHGPAIAGLQLERVGGESIEFLLPDWKALDRCRRALSDALGERFESDPALPARPPPAPPAPMSPRAAAFVAAAFVAGLGTLVYSVNLGSKTYHERTGQLRSCRVVADHRSTVVVELELGIPPPPVRWELPRTRKDALAAACRAGAEVRLVGYTRSTLAGEIYWAEAIQLTRSREWLAAPEEAGGSKWGDWVFVLACGCVAALLVVVGLRAKAPAKDLAAQMPG